MLHSGLYNYTNISCSIEFWQKHFNFNLLPYILYQFWVLLQTCRSLQHKWRLQHSCIHHSKDLIYTNVAQNYNPFMSWYVSQMPMLGTIFASADTLVPKITLLIILWFTWGPLWTIPGFRVSLFSHFSTSFTLHKHSKNTLSTFAVICDVIK